MNMFNRLFDYWESRGEYRRVITDAEARDNAKPLSSAIVNLKPYRKGDSKLENLSDSSG